jgi:mono/diheme cytochrome c family protein
MTRLKVLLCTVAILAVAGAVQGYGGFGNRRDVCKLAGRATSEVNGLGDPQNQAGPISPEHAKTLKSPIAFTKQSIARGRITFSRNCTVCHGADGKAQVDVVANATDLTDPKAWQSGTLEGQIFRSIRDGAGNGMPPFKAQLHDEQAIWDLVNYIRSLWPEAARPKLQEDAPAGPKK